jgi:ABC-type amino acid transport system permease subunit
VLSLALNTAAFNSEVWRAGIVDFPRGQLEAARSFGMTRRTAFWRIMFPQIWRRSVAPIVNEMTLLIKASPAIAIIGVVDLTRKARQVAEATYEPLPAFISAVIVYGIVLITLVVGGRLLERRIAARTA